VGATAAGAGAAAAAGGAASASKSAGSGARGQAADKFAKEWLKPGTRPIDTDGNGASCFDVFHKYSTEVMGAPGTIATDSMNASDIYNHYDRNGVSEYYTQIPVGQGQAEPGDVVVYGPGPFNEPYGHVALVTGVNGSHYTVLEQGYATNAPPRSYDYAFADSRSSGPILGYLRPKKVNL
jgi:hypothetical protein